MGNRNENNEAKGERTKRNGYFDMCIIDSGNCGYYLL